MDEQEYEWANVERPVKEEAEEPKTCSLEDGECLSCGS
jgi:hypothetical protein